MDSWDLQRPQGKLSHGLLVGVVDIEFPQRGLHDIAWDGTPLPGVALMGVEPPGAPAQESESVLDSYARGNDLVVTYAQSPTRSVRPQCYWRAFDCATTAGACTGIELIFSMQTSLLESAPQASVLTKLADGDVQRLVDAPRGQFAAFTGGSATPENGTGLFLFTPTGTPWRVVTMIEPSDFIAAELSPLDAASTQEEGNATAPTQVLRYQLFPHSLEKGVIRRARLAGLILPGEGNAQELALECYKQFQSTPLPLST